MAASGSLSSHFNASISSCLDECFAMQFAWCAVKRRGPIRDAAVKFALMGAVDSGGVEGSWKPQFPAGLSF